MRRTVLSLALILVAVASPLLAQEEPPLFENPPAPKEGAPAATPPGTTPCPPAASSLGVKVPKMDAALWQAMPLIERQTYVEIAIGVMSALSERLREDAASSRTMARDDVTASIRFANQYSPRRAPTMYLKEMERIYLTAEGQKLSMSECFYKAFERLNIPAAMAPPPQTSKTPAAPGAGQ